MSIPSVYFFMRFENGECEQDEIVEEFQKMIDSGAVWKLQGAYGRSAKSLIEQGLCHLPGEQE